jgi:hypothetical protein
MHNDQFTKSVKLGTVYMAISPYHGENGSNRLL